MAFLTALASMLAATATTRALTIGQIDTFEDGTAQNWIAGLLGSPHPVPPVNVASGGPGGAADNFLQITAIGGAGPGSRLSAVNFVGQWSGNYIDAGISAISADVRNLGQSDLYLRLAFSDPVAGPPANIAYSSSAIFLPAGGSWTSVVFPIQVANLTAGLGSVQTALENATELRIYHSQVPNFPNPVVPIESIVATLGVDNIQARSSARTPDAGSTALLLAGVLTGIGFGRTWTRHRHDHGKR